MEPNYFCIVSTGSRNSPGGYGQVVCIIHPESAILAFADGENRGGDDVDDIDAACAILEADGKIFRAFPDTAEGRRQFVDSAAEFGLDGQAREWTS